MYTQLWTYSLVVTPRHALCLINVTATHTKGRLRSIRLRGRYSPCNRACNGFPIWKRAHPLHPSFRTGIHGAGDRTHTHTSARQGGSGPFIMAEIHSQEFLPVATPTASPMTTSEESPVATPDSSPSKRLRRSQEFRRLRPDKAVAVRQSPEKAVVIPQVQQTPSESLALGTDTSSRPGMQYSKHVAIQHFMDRSLELKEARSMLHPLSSARVAWRWTGSFLLLMYCSALMHASFRRYHCDADEFCNPSIDGSVAAAHSRQLALAQGVQAYSGLEVVCAIITPRPTVAGGLLTHVAAGSHIWRAGILSVPLDIVLALPWWDLLAFCHPQLVKLASTSVHVDLEDLLQGATTPDPTARQGAKAAAGIRRWFARSPIFRALAAVHRVRTLPPPPRLLQPLLEEYVVPLMLARSFGSGGMAVVRLVQALPDIGDALWEAQILQAFLAHFLASAKMCLLLATSWHAARTRIRLQRRRKQIREQIAARRVAKHARRFVIYRAENGMVAAERTAAQLAAIETYRRRSKLHRVRNGRPAAQPGRALS